VGGAGIEVDVCATMRPTTSSWEKLWAVHSKGGVKPPHSKALRAHCRKMPQPRNGSVDSTAQGAYNGAKAMR